jgi:hypothetical protein
MHDAKDAEAHAREYFETLRAEEPRQRNTLQRFATFVYEADDMVEIVLKCHLLIEEALTRIIAKYVPHPEFVEQSSLTFWQKLNIARSMSLDESENGMWLLVAGFNKLRNDYGHSLEPPRASEHVKALRDRYFAEFPELAKDKDLPDGQILKDVAIALLGFLGTFEEEVERFRWWLEKLDRIVNAHRQTRKDEPSKA